MNEFWPDRRGCGGFQRCRRFRRSRCIVRSADKNSRAIPLKGSNGFRRYGAGFMTAPIIKRVSGRFLSRVHRNSKDVEAMATSKTYPSLTADEAAALIPNGAMVTVSGFTPAGARKAVPRALAKRARELPQAGTAFQGKLLSGASTGAACDDDLAGAEAVSWRAPYMTSAPCVNSPIPER